MPSSKVKTAIRAFERAVKERATKAATPELGLVLEHNYVKARAKLERLMENV